MRFFSKVWRFLGEALLIAFCMFVIAMISAATIHLLGPGLVEAGNAKAVEFALAASPVSLTKLLIFIGIAEEIIFRILPLGITLFVVRRWRILGLPRATIMVSVILVSSALFGYAHGNVQAIFLQGAGALVLAMGFLLAESRSGWVYASLLVITAHIAYDAALVNFVQFAQGILDRAPAGTIPS